MEITEQETEERIETFWLEIKDLAKRLTKANPQCPIYELTNPLLTDYLLWRVLNEVKSSKTKQTLNQH